MPFKINIAEKGKTYRFEYDGESLVGKKIGDTLEGKDVKEELSGYTFNIAGASDKAGFPLKKDLEGEGLQKVLMTYGKGRKISQNKRKKPQGIRLRKTTRGNTLNLQTVQVNLVIEKQGSKTLKEIFPDQNQPKEEPKKEEAPQEAPKTDETPKETPAEEKKPEEKPAEEPKEEVKEPEEPKEEKKE